MENDIVARERRAKLVARFKAQARFCETVSVLYYRLFATLGEQLEMDDEFAAWLLAASSGRASFDVPLLTLAALHFHVLSGSPETRDLAEFYPDVGGVRSPEEPEFAVMLMTTLSRLAAPLADFIATRPVQTNECGRGLCWLLPVAYTGWPAMTLVELGTSAGLNLIADLRPYAVLPVEGKELMLGQGERELAHIVPTEGPFVPPPICMLPQILSRNGCDLAPILLQERKDRDYLASFVWADQPARLRTLQSGMDALASLAKSPSLLKPCRLPEELPAYLASLSETAAKAPTVLFNSYITPYLPEKGRGLRTPIADWAECRCAPTLWLQWEHRRDTANQVIHPPSFGWLAWTAELWLNGQHYSWQLAWVHPHGSRALWLQGLADWRDFWQEQGAAL